MRKKGKKIKKLIVTISFISALMTAYLIYSILLLDGIEDKIRLLFSIDLIVIHIAFFFGYIRSSKKYKKTFVMLFLLNLIYIPILGGAGYYINKTYKAIDKMTTDSTTYSTSLVTLSTNKVDNIKDVSQDDKIGIVDDENSLTGYQLPKAAISENNLKNEIEEYGSYVELIKALYDKKVEYIFLPSNYVSMFLNMEEVDLSDIDKKTKTIYIKDKIEQKSVTSKNSSLKDPFTVLIMGVDSEQESLAGSSFNGDALMLITFNPSTLNTTILSIPRDSYVPIACFSGQKKNKITHAAWYGEKCMMNTISNFTGIDIDYYVKINFKGVVNIIDALGGIEVDVPYSFCEQDSNRKFGKNTIYVKKGKQKLNGEQALALSRNRKANSSKCTSAWTSGTRNDFVRGQNQQLVLRATLNKLKTIKNLDTIYNILDKVSNSMQTDMSTNEILSLYNVAKDIIVKSNSGEVEDLIGIQKLYLNGQDARIYDTSTGLYLYNYVLYDNSIKAVSNAMKVNLGKKKPTLVKKFSFDIDKEYKEEVIGKNETGKVSSAATLPSFIGMSESTAKSKAKSLGINVSFNYVTTGSGTVGTVIKQSKNAGTDITYVKELVLTVLQENQKKDTVENSEKTDDVKNETEKKEDTKSDPLDTVTGIDTE